MKGFFKHIVIITLAILLALVSCKEDPVYDILYPKEYFPAYPGSYWVYNNGVTKNTEAYYSLVNLNSEDIYVSIYDGQIVNGYLVGYKEILNFNGSPWKVGEFDAQDVFREIINLDTSIVVKNFPFIDSSYCDTIIKPNPITTFPVDTTINLVQVNSCDGYEFCDTILINCDNPHFCDTLFYALIEEITYLDTIIIDTLIQNCSSFITYDSVIVVKEYVSTLDELNCWFYKDYYAKNIGLVKREVANCSDSSSYITEFELVNYKINK